MRAGPGRKGVSPLIAAVLLIAFTMAVAAILTAWVTTFTEEQTQQLGNESEQQIDCSFAQLEVFDTSAGADWVNVAVTNRGTVDFTNVSITVLNSGNVVGEGSLGLVSGSTDNVNISDLDDSPETLRIVPNRCPSTVVTEQVQ